MIIHAHQKAIIHRDFNPSIVMTTIHGGRPVLKVIGTATAAHDMEKFWKACGATWQ